MIRRRAAGAYLLIRQTDHARLAAEIAAAVGNGGFAAPLPRGAVLQAVEKHDDGWDRYDDRPVINSRGQPIDVFETPAVTAMSIWSASTVAAGGDPYVGLLVSLHGLALSLHIKPEKSSARSDTFALIKFQHAQIEMQEDCRRRLGMETNLPLQNGLAGAGTSPDEDLLRRNFSLLQFADQLSLNLCFDECRFPQIELQGRVTFQRNRDGSFSVEPWPFERGTLQLTAPAREIPERFYANDEDLRRAVADARQTTIALSLIARK